MKINIKNHKKYRKHLIITVCFILTVFSVLLPGTVKAASLFFSPTAGSYNVGDTFSASVYVSSADQSMNAASGVVSFPRDKLEVSSISKTGSVITLWVQEPSFSNSAGTINFEGIVLNPGFTGASGKIITINFKVKTGGTALLNFSSGSVLANDGQGTNILATLGGAQFSLGGVVQPIPETTTPSVVSDTTSAPVISSSTHPDQNKWYNNSNAKFTWPLSNDIMSVRLLYDKNSNSQPNIVYTPPIAEKEIDNIADGIYYFHAQFKNKYGWGDISHFKFQIDTQSPEPFTIKFVDGEKTDNPRPIVIFDTTDALSGIDYYKVKIGDSDFFNVDGQILKNNSYTLPLQTPGERTILVQAFDKAGNYATASADFTIESINTPIISDWPAKIQRGDVLTIKGKTYPDSQVTIWFQIGTKQPFSQIVKSDRDGNFVFTDYGTLKSGIYQIWAEVTDSRGAKSNPTDKITIVVEQPAFLKIGSWAFSSLTVIILLLIFVTLLISLIMYGWYRISLFKNKLRKEVFEAEQSLQKAFNSLREDITNQIKMFEKSGSQFAEKKEKTIRKLKKDLEDAETSVKKEIKDIKKI